MFGMTINHRIRVEKDLSRKKALELVKKHNSKNINCVNVIIDSRTTIQLQKKNLKNLVKLR